MYGYSILRDSCDSRNALAVQREILVSNQNIGGVSARATWNHNSVAVRCGVYSVLDVGLRAGHRIDRVPEGDIRAQNYKRGEQEKMLHLEIHPNTSTTRLHLTATPHGYQ